MWAIGKVCRFSFGGKAHVVRYRDPFAGKGSVAFYGTKARVTQIAEIDIAEFCEMQIPLSTQIWALFDIDSSVAFKYLSTRINIARFLRFEVGSIIRSIELCKFVRAILRYDGSNGKVWLVRTAIRIWIEFQLYLGGLILKIQLN